jgi:hypothetical protein
VLRIQLQKILLMIKLSWLAVFPRNEGVPKHSKKQRGGGIDGATTFDLTTTYSKTAVAK